MQLVREGKKNQELINVNISPILETVALQLTNFCIILLFPIATISSY